MKKLLFVTLALTMLSCSKDECNVNCGTVVSVVANINLPMNGDETYQIDFKTECGEFETVWIPFNIEYGFPGEDTQPVQKVMIGDTYCK